MVASFQMAGMLAEEIEVLKILQRKLMLKGPRCFKWRIVMLSGPVAVEFLQFLMASVTEWGVKGEKFGSNLCMRWILRIILRVVGSWQWVTMEVNCLLKRFAIDWCLVKVLVPNLMG